MKTSASGRGSHVYIIACMSVLIDLMIQSGMTMVGTIASSRAPPWGDVGLPWRSARFRRQRPPSGCCQSICNSVMEFVRRAFLIFVNGVGTIGSRVWLCPTSCRPCILCFLCCAILLGLMALFAVLPHVPGAPSVVGVASLV